MLHFLKNKIMVVFNFGRKENLEKERLEKERDELKRKLEELEYELKKQAEKQRRDNNYDYYKKESYYSFDEYDYKDLFNDETFKQFFKQAYGEGGGSNYNRYKQEYSSYSSNTALDNAFQLMKLNENDSETTIKKRYRELSLK